MKGRQLRSALENSVSLYGQQDGRFLQVSGLAVTYDVTRPSGERVIDVRVDGEPMSDERFYSVAMPRFLARGGDGFRSFRFADDFEHPRDGIQVIEALSDYLRTLPRLAPTVDGRISFAN